MMRKLGSTRKSFAYRPRVEALEDRLAPATLVNPTTLTYLDFDGDDVTVKISKPLFVQSTINAVFDFDTGSVDQSNAVGQRLETINLSNLGAAASGLSLTLTAVRSPVNGPNGFANVGLIDANAIDLKAVTIDGDLSQIVAGDSTSTTPALFSLTVQSLGRFAAGGLVSDFQGRVGTISVKSDVVGVTLQTHGNSGPDDVNATIDSITIGGSLIGVGLSNNSGLISSGGDIGVVKIAGNVIGAGGANSGQIMSLESIQRVKIGGSVMGGSGPAQDVLGDGSLLVGAGSILSMKTMGRVTIGGDLVGADGPGSGVVATGAILFPVFIVNGSIRGGGGAQSGWVFSGGDMGLMTVGIDLIGGAGAGSGAIRANGNLAGITIVGSVLGGSGAAADVLGDGSLLVGAGSILSMKTLGLVSIGGDLLGGDGPGSGVIADVQGSKNPSEPTSGIKGSIRGGVGAQSGLMFSGGDMGLMTVGVDLIGGAGAGSGAIRSIGRLAGLTVGGSISSGLGADSGSLRTGDDLGVIIVKGSLIGSAGNPVVIAARGQAVVAPGAATDLAITSVKVGGRAEFANILAGVNLSGGGVNADAQIGKLKVTGDWIASSLAAGVSSGDGFFGNGDDGKMSGPDVKDSPSISSQIGKIVIGGAILGTPAGLDHYGFAAELVLAFTQGGTKVPVQAGAHGDDLLLAANTGDVRLREV